MNCLAIDTSTDFLSLALQWQGQQAVLHEPAGQAHAERALPGVRRLLDEMGVRLAQLDSVVFGQGPGSFTGLRIACGLAQGLAFSAGLPVIAIPTLDAMAEQKKGRVLVCLDARMQQVYCAGYDTEHWQRLTPIMLRDPQDVVLPEAASGWIGIGSGFRQYPSSLTERLAPALIDVDDGIVPNATSLIRLAESGRYAAGHPRDAGLLYVRDKVALTSQEQQARRQ
ncbi:MAG: tRNA (adenosine(37)-N6)-threonylcarbamoyltransferase complex dimerization subunit type 1 TsaB [Paludibacterium sp.]|uniref:tRNA (adenosine(37)-N6)-threonylcarbamoyltransferase complex dimerization subunit type 1 TsaB n=1 Tax=Paludibacterium sp. TaxID=1917523 RepID=UPI0025D751D1|nr:tRNA (adenosine(37)-N6)-threonylcarbamoyltransferase complex dimerization subunit type 1 TsaB [Paludibacterium sp.]MBV8047649.1 tRNA (adenosine(37)-N6)-threonylcarbamoyltransferase complex dimerization subunit type 1 TsaB [Paludibacterium sp.]MBV8648384.1 tRNA (adenosine(37)-N6)-threonylcarbamoyltransferase complex dimerization subunit type 1 TsaB [Paludibacterium sp.]